MTGERQMSHPSLGRAERRTEVTSDHSALLWFLGSSCSRSFQKPFLNTCRTQRWLGAANQVEVNNCGSQLFAQLVSAMGFCAHGTMSEDWGLLGRDGIHLSKWDKNVFANRQLSLVRRPLRQEQHRSEMTTHSQVRRQGTGLASGGYKVMWTEGILWSTKQDWKWPTSSVCT